MKKIVFSLFCFYIVYAFTYFFEPCTLSSKEPFSPWGSDASLAFCLPRKEDKKTTTSASLFSQAAEQVIYFHQKVLSEADGPRSHYIPTSSRYALLAIRKYGFFKGYILTCDRLIRENNEPWIYPTCITMEGHMYKLDPVP